MNLPERREATDAHTNQNGDEGLDVVEGDRMTCQLVDSCLRMLLKVLLVVFEVLVQVPHCFPMNQLQDTAVKQLEEEINWRLSVQVRCNTWAASERHWPRPSGCGRGAT